jgi:hypothetical protein
VWRNQDLRGTSAKPPQYSCPQPTVYMTTCSARSETQWKFSAAGVLRHARAAPGVEEINSFEKVSVFTFVSGAQSIKFSLGGPASL